MWFFHVTAINVRAVCVISLIWWRERWYWRSLIKNTCTNTFWPNACNSITQCFTVITFIRKRLFRTCLTVVTVHWWYATIPTCTTLIRFIIRITLISWCSVRLDNRSWICLLANCSWISLICSSRISWIWCSLRLLECPSTC